MRLFRRIQKLYMSSNHMHYDKKIHYFNASIVCKVKMWHRKIQQRNSTNGIQIEILSFIFSMIRLKTSDKISIGFCDVIEPKKF